MIAGTGTMTAIGEEMMVKDVEAEIVVSTLTIGTKVRLVAPISSPTCDAIAENMTSTVPTVNVWSHCLLH